MQAIYVHVHREYTCLNSVRNHVYVTVFTLMTDYISCMTVLLLFEQGTNVA